ncbi:MAG: hypothetical protein KQJ78_11110 [Deltaproteobacteria bacterium]|nr:hypothetical protein [Deltaproteobacteria bacterium]
MDYFFQREARRLDRERTQTLKDLVTAVTANPGKFLSLKLEAGLIELSTLEMESGRPGGGTRQEGEAARP